MLNNASSLWLKYITHVLKWEGGQSKNPSDQAASCVSPGQVHTNKGVTYCTFRDLAAQLGVLPVSYNHFLNMTDAEAGKFIYLFYETVSGADYPDTIAIFLTESAWGSGRARAFKHLQEALNDLGKNVAVTQSSTAATILAARQVSEALLFDQYYKRRYSYLIDYLGNLPAYAMFKNGWRNRLEDFYMKYKPGGGINVTGVLAAMLAFIMPH